jgi:hypothetical protein
MSPLSSFVQVSASISGVPTSVTAPLFKALRSLRPDGRFKSVEQAQATQLVHLRNQHVLVVMPTNAGKTLIVSVNARAESTAAIGSAPMITVMLAPTTSLLDDLKDRFEKERIPVVQWAGNNTHALSILLATYEGALSHSFLEYCRGLVQVGRLARIVVDECHYPRQNTQFRITLQKLNLLVSLGAPMLLLTGSLPPVEVIDTLKFFGIDQANVIRMRTARANIRYTSQLDPLPYKTDELEHAYAVLVKFFEKHKPSGRIIVFCQKKDLVNHLCKRNADWWPYHADVHELEKKRCVEQWSATERNIVIATSAFGVGIDRPDVLWVFHLGAPRNMADYIQESGRAGRGDADAEARIITWRPVQEPHFNSAGSGLIPDFVTSQSLCRRVILEGYADGYAFNCFSQPVGTVLCDNCERQLAAQSTTTYIAPQTVGPSIVHNAVIAAQRNAPSRYTALLHGLGVLDKKCKACYLKGSGPISHGWQFCDHVLGAAKTQFNRWRDSIKFKKRREAICFKCHLPFENTAFHRPQTDAEIVRGTLRKKVCYFGDQLVPILWLVWHFPALRSAFDSWSGTDLGSEDKFARWIEGEDDAGLSRSAKVFLEVDKWLEARRVVEGTSSVWTIQHERPMSAPPTA